MKKTSYLQFRTTPELKQRLSERALKKGVTLTNLVSTYVYNGLESDERAETLLNVDTIKTFIESLSPDSIKAIADLRKEDK